MRGKRSKQYRKLMHAYELTFNFRSPYQVLLDASIIRDTHKYHMDLPHLLERTLHGPIKPMITQCSIRHLYTAIAEDKADKSAWIEIAKRCERRRCGHQELEEPLGTKECILSVVDPKGSGTNRHRYIVASQDVETRQALREVAGVPLVYVQRSVMVMEPMARKSEAVKGEVEGEKIRAGVKRGKGSEQGVKRKRDDQEGETAAALEDRSGIQAQVIDGDQAVESKRKKKKGPKEPNPMSMKKPKKRDADGEGVARKSIKEEMPDRIERQIRAAKEAAKEAASLSKGEDADGRTKKKRWRRHGNEEASIDHVEAAATTT